MCYILQTVHNYAQKGHGIFQAVSNHFGTAKVLFQVQGIRVCDLWFMNWHRNRIRYEDFGFTL